jgi:hypothetical protein
MKRRRARIGEVYRGGDDAGAARRALGDSAWIWVRPSLKRELNPCGSVWSPPRTGVSLATGLAPSSAPTCALAPTRIIREARRLTAGRPGGAASGAPLGAELSARGTGVVCAARERGPRARNRRHAGGHEHRGAAGGARPWPVGAAAAQTALAMAAGAPCPWSCDPREPGGRRRPARGGTCARPGA